VLRARASLGAQRGSRGRRLPAATAYPFLVAFALEAVAVGPEA
jgi:hypothetical protein